MRLSSVLVLCVTIFFVAQVRAEDDAAYVRERLRRALPKSVSGPTNWEVSYLGRTEKWTWSSKGTWSCPKSTEINCTDFKPRVLLWWPVGHNWFANARPVKRLRYELGKPKPKTVPPTTVDSEVSPEALPPPVEEEELPVFRSQTFAVDLWRWTVGEQDYDLGISLRSQLPEWIDGESRRELIEWEMPKTRGQLPRIARIILETDRDRFVFTPLWPARKGDAKKEG